MSLFLLSAVLFIARYTLWFKLALANQRSGIGMFQISRSLIGWWYFLQKPIILITLGRKGTYKSLSGFIEPSVNSLIHTGPDLYSYFLCLRFWVIHSGPKLPKNSTIKILFLGLESHQTFQFCVLKNENHQFFLKIWHKSH